MFNKSKTIKIAICGVPLAGKTELLESILKIDNVGQLEVFEYLLKEGKVELESKPCPERFFYGEVNINGKDITLFTAPYSIFFWDEVYEKVFSICDAVIYVFTAVLNSWESQEFEERYYQHHLNAAKKYEKEPNQIPWCFIINKSHLDTYIPLSIKIPEYLRKEAIRTKFDIEEDAEKLNNQIKKLIEKLDG